MASGAVGGGFTTTVLPASSACGSAAARIASGQLNGTMIVTTPSGRCATSVRYGGAGSRATSSTRSASAVASSNRWANTRESTNDSIRILPFSRVSTSAVAGRSASSGARAAVSSAARSCGRRAAQAGKACCAAVTASCACLALAAAA